MHRTDGRADSGDRFRTVVAEDERVSEAVVRVVSTVAETDPLDLEPLGAHVDFDAVDSLFEPGPGVSNATARTLTFRYDEYTITVDDTGDERVCLVRSQ